MVTLGDITGETTPGDGLTSFLRACHALLDKRLRLVGDLSPKKLARGTDPWAVVVFDRTAPGLMLIPIAFGNQMACEGALEIERLGFEDVWKQRLGGLPDTDQIIARLEDATETLLDMWPPAATREFTSRFVLAMKLVQASPYLRLVTRENFGWKEKTYGSSSQTH